MSTKTYPCGSCMHLHSPMADDPCRSCADGSNFVDWRQEIERLRAEVAALRAQETVGWKLVPVEPTERMVGDGGCAVGLPGLPYIGDMAARQALGYMLAAAPQRAADDREMQPLRAGMGGQRAKAKAPESITGWKLNHARPHPEHTGVWEIGHLSDEDWFSPVVVVDTGNYDQDDQAQPLATAILAALALSTDEHRANAAIGDALTRVVAVLSSRALTTNSSGTGIGEFNGCAFRLTAVPGSRSLAPEWARVLPATAAPSDPTEAGG